MTPGRMGVVRTSRRGLTLIEALVVVSILGILLGLLIPAVIGARESARRATCVSRMQQIGLALHAHHATHRYFPPPMSGRQFHKGQLWASEESLSGYYELLPYLDLGSLYHAINADTGEPPARSPVSPRMPQNATVLHSKFNHFICPSDSVALSHPGGPCSYRFNVGSAIPQETRSGPKAGTFVYNEKTRGEDIRDGLSQTAGFAERLIGSQSPGPFDRRRDLWGAHVFGLFPVGEDSEVVLRVCRSLRRSPTDFITYLGSSWMFSGAEYVWYNHVAPPNDQAADCILGDTNTHHQGSCHYCSLGARSFHSGGVNTLLMDGSVRFVTGGVATPIWRALGTRAGGEVGMSLD